MHEYCTPFYPAGHAWLVDEVGALTCGAIGKVPGHHTKELHICFTWLFPLLIMSCSLKSRCTVQFMDLTKYATWTALDRL